MKSSTGASGLQRNPPGEALLWAHFACARQRGLRKSAISGKLLIAKSGVFPEPDDASPPFPGGFRVSRVCLSQPRVGRDSRRTIPPSAGSLREIPPDRK